MLRSDISGQELVTPRAKAGFVGRYMTIFGQQGKSWEWIIDTFRGLMVKYSPLGSSTGQR